MENTSLAKMKDQLEYLFMRVIISKLKTDKIQPIQAKQLAQEFVKIEPFTTIEDAHSKIDQFVTTHTDFSLLKEYSDVFYDEEHLEDKLEIMRKHLKENNIDEALRVIHS